MRRPDDSTVDPHQQEQIRAHARAALVRADALGRLPTPVSRIVQKAQLEVSTEDVLDESFLQKLRRKSGSVLRAAISKVRGVLDVVGKLIYLDKTVKVVRQVFITLHETGHSLLPWQRDAYSLIEDCDKTLDPDVSELFDREANVFACEVLFQLDQFAKDAGGEPVNILVPVNLSKRYGASVYASVRRYVSTHHRACCVVIIDLPEPEAGVGFRANL